MTKPDWTAKAEWMMEWAKVCTKCEHTAAPVAGVVPFDSKGECWYCRNNIEPTPPPKRRTVRP